MVRRAMSKKIKYSKVAIVAFLTVLIWVWADLAMDETLLVPNVSINIVTSSNPALWATFKSEDGQPVSSASIEYIVLKGPTSGIAEAKRELSNALLNLDFALNPELREMTTAGPHTLPVLDFLRKSSEIRELSGLTVESCEPNKLTVSVEMLLETPLAVKCFDQGGRLQEFQSIEPATVTMFAPEGWGRDSPARVVLTPSEIEQARSTSVQKKPYIVLADGQERHWDKFVQVRIPPEEDILGKLKARGVTVKYCFSAVTQGLYRVEVENKAEVENEIDIRATPEAKQAYEEQAYQVSLEIYDQDVDVTDWVPRPLKYDFPDEYMRRGEIELDQDPVTAKFKLVPLSSADGP